MRDLEGTATNDLSPADVAFHTLREYVPGDDRRSIHWRTSARTNKLMVRQFVDTRRTHLGLVLSTRAEDYANEEEFEIAVSVAGSLGVSALAAGQQLTSVADDAALSVSSRTHFLDHLAGVELHTRGDDVGAVTRKARQELDVASVAFLITGSRASVRDVRAASTWLPSHLRRLAVRVDASVAPAFRSVRDVQILTVNSASDLVPRMRAMAVR
jgi:uncharacterized protein (DUF58 family)